MDPEEEFVSHICRVLDDSLAANCDLHLDLTTNGRSIIQSKLRDVYRLRAIDNMEWFLLCGAGEVPFDQGVEDELPILCRFYNDFLGGEPAWTDQDHTMMMVLNRYDRIKAGRYGNFAESSSSQAQLLDS